MKVVVQNGAEHPLSRKDVEAFVRNLPYRYRKLAGQLVLCKGELGAAMVIYHEKRGSLDLFCGRDVPAAVALEELGVALVAISETGDVPDKITASRRIELVKLAREAGLVTASH